MKHAFRPRQAISAINIPLSVMMAPVLACRLVSDTTLSPFAYKHLPNQSHSQILDLRERGAQTVSHSEGTGIAAFTTKSGSHGSPFTAGHRSKSRAGPLVRPHTLNSNIMLSTLGSIPPDTDIDYNLEQDVVEMNELHIDLGIDMDLNSSSSSTRPDAEARGDGHEGSPAPAYHSLEMGFRPRGPSLECDLSRIRVDVEKTTSTI
jgi:hypothetical protein